MHVNGHDDTQSAIASTVQIGHLLRPVREESGKQ
jgi:hypothetical protein